MKEKLQTLPLAQLRELAKAQGLKGITTLRKFDDSQRVKRTGDNNDKRRSLDIFKYYGNYQ